MTADITLYSELFEVFLNSGVKDSKGRWIGFTLGFRDDGTDFRAYVQNSRLVKGEWINFGAGQPSKKFSTRIAANTWAYQSANQRIAKLQKSI